MQAKEYALDVRKPGQAIELGPSVEQVPSDECIREGAYVVVKLRGMPIDLEVLDEEESGTFVGHIRGWEGHAGRKHKDLVVGDVLRFREEHVFECRHELAERPQV